MSAGVPSRRLLRSSAVVGAGTALSRASGLLRVGALAYAMGASPLTDAYNVANNTPNIVYELVLGGILSATLVPIFVEQAERDDRRSRRAVSSVLSVAVVALVGLTVIAMVAAPVIVKLYTWRLSDAEARAQEAVAVPLLRLFLPQILFYGLTTLGTALLHARRRFALPAFAPVLNNVVVSAMLVALPWAAGREPSLDLVRDDRGLLVLIGLGTTAGVVLMTVVLWPALRAAGWRVRWWPDWRHPSVASLARLSGWTVGYVVANQLALFVILALANQGEGALSAYAFAFVFFQLPHGLFAVSIMTTTSPELASAAGRGQWDDFRARFSLGTRLILLVVVPAAAGYVVLAEPLVDTVLGRGAFSAADVALTADVLANFALGLAGFSLYLYALRGFYALRDTRTPFVLNVVENSVNVVLAVALVGRYGVQGLAAAYSVAYTVAGVLAFVVLRRRIGGLDGHRLVATGARLVTATAAMVAVVVAVTSFAGDDQGAGALVRVALAVPAGAIAYGAVLVALRTEELTGLLDRRRSRGQSRSK